LRQLATRFDVRLPTFGDDRARVAAMSKGDDGGGARPPLREVADAAWKLLGLAGGEEEEEEEDASSPPPPPPRRGVFGRG
jgi:hypothetical protein